MTTSAPYHQKLFRLVIAAAIVLLIGWLSNSIFSQALAARYMALSEESRERAGKEVDPSARDQLLAASANFMAKAILYAPKDPELRLWLVKNLPETDRDAAVQYLITALHRAPTRSDLWAELTKRLYAANGASADTLKALDKALFFGGSEIDVLLINAVITLNSWQSLSTQQKQRGWSLTVAAMAVPELRPSISAHAQRTGFYKQLQRSLREGNGLHGA